MEHNNSYGTAIERYLGEVASTEPLAPADEASLIARVAKGDHKAEELLARGYLRKVVAIAKTYHVEGVSFEDLVNEGNLGLVNAIRHYKAGSKVEFAAYASRHIRESINSSLASRHELVLKPAVGKAVRGKIARAARLFQQQNERRPDISELAAMVGMPEQQVMDIIHSSHQSRSIDAPVRRGGNVAMADLLASRTAASASDTLDTARLRRLVGKAASQLGERERNVANYYYGLADVQLNMAEIAEKYGLKRERVRQIRDSATRKLRKMLRHVSPE